MFHLYSLKCSRNVLEAGSFWVAGLPTVLYQQTKAYLPHFSILWCKNVGMYTRAEPSNDFISEHHRFYSHVRLYTLQNIKRRNYIRCILRCHNLRVLRPRIQSICKKHGCNVSPEIGFLDSNISTMKLIYKCATKARSLKSSSSHIGNFRGSPLYETLFALD